jgi:hypothetical protein
MIDAFSICDEQLANASEIYSSTMIVPKSSKMVT